MIVTKCKKCGEVNKIEDIMLTDETIFAMDRKIDRMKEVQAATENQLEQWRNLYHQLKAALSVEEYQRLKKKNLLNV